MRQIIFFAAILLSYSLIYAGLSHFGLPYFAAPKDSATSSGSGGGGTTTAD